MIKHQCQALVIACIDFRFVSALFKFIKKAGLENNCDLLTAPGSAKAITNIIDYIDVSARLHKIKEVVLINHEDCGAYGGLARRSLGVGGSLVFENWEKELACYKKDLRKASKIIQKKYPLLKISCYVLRLNSQFPLRAD